MTLSRRRYSRRWKLVSWRNGTSQARGSEAAPTHDVKTPELRFNRAAESFSHGWELPARLTGGAGEGIPQDARFKPGSGGQLIAFVPSLDLVVTRQTGSSGAGI